MPWHTVRAGEWLVQIAYRQGFSDADAIWQLPENQELRASQRDPNQLLPGDRVFLPARVDAHRPVATGKTNRFVLKKVTQKLRVAVHGEDGKPLKSTPFRIHLGGRELTGTSDGEGVVQVDLPPSATEARLEIGEVEIVLRPGHLDPVESASGLRDRLENLGFDVEEGNLADTIRAFQRQHQLPESGENDAATRRKLTEAHGC